MSISIMLQPWKLLRRFERPLDGSTLKRRGALNWPPTQTSSGAEAIATPGSTTTTGSERTPPNWQLASERTHRRSKQHLMPPRTNNRFANNNAAIGYGYRKSDVNVRPQRALAPNVPHRIL